MDDFGRVFGSSWAVLPIMSNEACQLFWTCTKPLWVLYWLIMWCELRSNMENPGAVFHP